MESDFPKTADSFRTETRPYPIGCPIRYNTVQSVLKKEKRKPNFYGLTAPDFKTQ